MMFKILTIIIPIAYGIFNYKYTAKRMAKRLEEQHIEYMKYYTNSKAKTLLAFKRLQAINELQIKYELLLTEHNKLQEYSDST